MALSGLSGPGQPMAAQQIQIVQAQVLIAAREPLAPLARAIEVPASPVRQRRQRTGKCLRWE